MIDTLLRRELSAVEIASYQARGATDVFLAIDKSLQRMVGHRLLTILTYDDTLSAAMRLYSSQPKIYPAGISDPIVSSSWADQLLRHGRPYVGNCAADLDRVFAYHDRLASLKLGSVVNMPIRWRGKVKGTLNMLDGEGHYTALDIDAVKAIAHMALPALLDG